MMMERGQNTMEQTIEHTNDGDNGTFRRRDQKVARSFHHKISLILTGCFMFSMTLLSIAFREEEKDVRRFLDQSDDIDYTTYSCNAIFESTEAGSTDACRFAKTCNGGDGLFASFVFCSSTFSYSTWCWILSPVLILWMVILFRMLGSTAEDFLSPSLEMFSFKLGLPPRFAGVSLLAFGNGAADVSATINAVNSDPKEGYLLSLGALSGAAMFIGCVVAGCVIVVAKGIPCRGALVRDVMAMLITVLVVFWNLLTGTIGPRAISTFFTIYLVFIVVVMVADVYHRAIVVPRVQRQSDEAEGARQLAARAQVNEAAGNALNAMATERQSTAAGAISIVLTALSNYESNPDEQDGWGIDSGELEHDRPVHLHGRNGLLTVTEPAQQNVTEGLSPETRYRMVEDGINRVCISHPGTITATNWSEAWHGGTKEFKQHFIAIWEDFMTDADLKIYERILLMLEFPFVAARMLSIPIPCEGYYCRAILAVSVLLSPLWFGYYMNVEHDVDLFWSGGFPWVFILLFASTLFAVMILRYAPSGDGVMNLAFATPIALFGFVMAATWIDFIADHLVKLLEFLGIICKIPPSIMGLTVLAWGNSMGDLSANMTMARKGLANMAMTACFAGPVFNILIGLALGFSTLSARTGVLDHPVKLNPSIITGFVAIIIHTVCLIAMGTFWFKAHIPKGYGYFTIGLYLTYLSTSIMLQFRSSRHHQVM